MDKTKLHMVMAIAAVAGLPAAGAGVASAAAPAAAPAASRADLLQPIPNAVERLKPADAQAASRDASQPPVLRIQYGYSYDYCRGYWRRDDYGRYYYYNPCRQRVYPYGRYYYYNQYGYPYRDQYGRYYYYNPYSAYPYGRNYYSPYAYPYRDEYGRYYYNPYGETPYDENEEP